MEQEHPKGDCAIESNNGNRGTLHQERVRQSEKESDIFMKK